MCLPSEGGALKVGIVGCGAVTEMYYAHALGVLEREGAVQVSALFDPDLDSVMRIWTKFPKASRAQEFEDLLNQHLGLVVVASPPACHAQQVIQALRAGKAVLCEKPLATTLADGRRMVEAANDTGRVLAVGLVRRFFPAARIIKNVLATGMLGSLRAFHCFEGGPFRWPVQHRAYFDRKIAGGGVLQDIGPHILDLLGWWLGPPTTVRYEDDLMGGVEATCRIRLEYDRFTGEIQLSRDWERPNRYMFQGSQAWLGWRPNDSEHIEIGFPGGESAAVASLHDLAVENALPAPGRPVRNFHQSFVEQIRNVVAAVRDNATPVASGVDALESVRLIEYCYGHRNLLPMPWLSDAEYRSARQLSDG